MTYCEVSTQRTCIAVSQTLLACRGERGALQTQGVIINQTFLSSPWLWVYLLSSTAVTAQGGTGWPAQPSCPGTQAGGKLSSPHK